MGLLDLTDLMEAVKKGKSTDVEYELNQVKDDKAKLETAIEHSGHTALFLAITYIDQHAHQEDALEIVRMLIEDGNMNIRHKSKGNEYTPLLLAAFHAQPEVVKMIWRAAKGTDILRDTSVDGDTALHLCAYAGDSHLETAKAILRILPDLKKVKNKADQLPIDVAVERNNKEMADLLGRKKIDEPPGCECDCVIQ